MMMSRNLSRQQQQQKTKKRHTHAHRFAFITCKLKPRTNTPVVHVDHNLNISLEVPARKKLSQKNMFFFEFLSLLSFSTENLYCNRSAVQVSMLFVLLDHCQSILKIFEFRARQLITCTYMYKIRIEKNVTAKLKSNDVHLYQCT